MIPPTEEYFKGANDRLDRRMEKLNCKRNLEELYENSRGVFQANEVKNESGVHWTRHSKLRS